MADKPLGRLVPTDDKHVRKYPFSAVMAATVARVESKIRLPSWHWQHNQGKEGACVGFALSMMMSLLNENQARAENTPPYVHKYNARWLWNEAKKVDEWPETNPGDDNGTSVRAGCDVLRAIGHVLVRGRVERPAALEQGIKENRWARTVDELRTCIAGGVPVTIGVNWYTDFDKPEKRGTEHFIPKNIQGFIRGGHAVCLYGASDKREAFAIKNSWGRDFPLAWLPYSVMDRLLREDGEACLVTDRV